jgi:flavin reductase (DIM6/NTAB) family NADH-FMN oxidoreductase RutF
MAHGTAVHPVDFSPSSVYVLPQLILDGFRMKQETGNVEKFDSNHFRGALSRFATGVTVITAKNSDGCFAGITVSSFNSVSLVPPLVLWSLATCSSNLPIFSRSSYYLINVLASDQRALAVRFASKVASRFEGVDFSLSHTGLPILEGAAAWFECANRSQYLEGDHVIFVGEVTRIGLSTRPGLIFQNGEFIESFSPTECTK